MNNEDLKLMLTESRDRIKELIAAINKLWAAEMKYFGEYGLEHEADCPQDDTCDCEFCQPWYEADEFAAKCIEKSNRRLERIKETLEGLEENDA